MVWKAKTHSGAKMRFWYTASGNIKLHTNGRRHLLSTKNAKRHRRLRQAGLLANGQEEMLRLMMPGK